VKAYNPESGWMSLDVKPGALERGLGPRIIVVGKSFWEPYFGMEVVARGKVDNHPRFGEQLKAEQIMLSPPSDRASRAAYIRYIVKDLTIQEAWQAAQFDGDLAQMLVPDIPVDKAEKLRGAWAERAIDGKQFAYLQDLGVSATVAIQIIRHFTKAGEDVRIVVSDNPYRLMEANLSFDAADRIALDSGLDRRAPQRIIAGLGETARRRMSQGHTVIGRKELGKSTGLMLGVAAVLADGHIGKAVDAGVLVLRVLADGERYQQSAMYELEQSIASDVSRLMGPGIRKNKPDADRIAEICGFIPEPEQVAAIARVFEQSLSIITGGPGVGKTSIMYALSESFPGQCLLLAPTGMGAKRLEEVTGCRASTIHSALKATMDGDRWVFGHNREDPLSLDGWLLVVDEASMVDTEVGAALFSAIPDGTTVVIVGDADQLPSVGAGSVLNDLIAAGIPTTFLKHIHRQGPHSPIPYIARDIIEGKSPKIPARGAARFVEAFSTQDGHDVIAIVRGMRSAGVKQEEVRVLAPMWRGPFGVDALNRGLQDLWNPPKREDGTKRSAGILSRKIKYEGTTETFDEYLYASDRVVMTKNDHERQVFNGDMLRVVDAGMHEGTPWVDAVTDTGVELRFEGSKQVAQLRLAYVTTVHRAQGAHVPHVVVALVEAHKPLLERRVLYTAVTRAQRTLTVVGNRTAIDMAVQNVGGVETRETGLRELCVALAGHPELELAASA